MKKRWMLGLALLLALAVAPLVAARPAEPGGQYAPAPEAAPAEPDASQAAIEKAYFEQVHEASKPRLREAVERAKDVPTFKPELLSAAPNAYTYILDHFEKPVLDPSLWLLRYDLNGDRYGEYFWGRSQCEASPRYGGVQGYEWSPSGDEMLLFAGGDIYRLELDHEAWSETLDAPEFPIEDAEVADALAAKGRRISVTALAVTGIVTIVLFLL